MERENTRIRYSISGLGSTCIAISADPPVPLEACSELIEKLAENYTVVAFEAPGFGFSYPMRLNSKHDLRTATSSVLEFLVKLHRGPYILALPCILGFSAWLHGDHLTMVHFSLASCFQIYMREDPELDKINQPCLIVWGNNDASHRQTDKSTTRSFCKNFHECVFDGIGYSPELENPDGFVLELVSFLAREKCRSVEQAKKAAG